MSELYHPGEVEVQERTGERSKAILNGRMIGSVIPAAARSFLSQQHYCAIGWTTDEGKPWASFIVAQPGFAKSDETGGALMIDLSPSDIAHASFGLDALKQEDRIGALFIELETRRRLRVNGKILAVTSKRLDIAVAEAYPNCPKYIQRRTLSTKTDETSVMQMSGVEITSEISRLISAADTFFVSSAVPKGQVDCSHRGGKPGFVQIEDGRLFIPDYPGNSMFGTLGNLAIYPFAGLSFMDFDRNRQLHLTGTTQLLLEGHERDGETGGTNRWWSFAPTAWTTTSLPEGCYWRYLDESPYNP